MRSILLCAGLLLGLCLAAQRRAGEQRDIVSPEELAQLLTANYSTQRQKVESIFRWITDNISYNVKSLTRTGSPVIYEEPDDTARVLKPLTERVAETVLRRRIAVCDGYARLFKSLCDHAGIGCEIITGYARVSWDRSHTRFRSNHKWNAVLIDNKWYLLDATWASGFITFRNEFIREYDSYYFLTPPEQFIRDHYPEDLNWTLMDKPPVVAEFYHSPLRYNGFIRCGITSYYPQTGVIDVTAGDSVRFQIESNSERKIFLVAEKPPVDSDDVEPDRKGAGYRKAEYVYAVSDTSPEWLYAICDGEVILRYKLNVRKTDTRTAR
jgi:hypothetical protein